MIVGDWSFRLHREPLSWPDAFDKCRLQNGVLMETRNTHALSVASAVMTSAGQTSDDIWLGMLNEPGNWALVDGTGNQSLDSKYV